MPDAFGAFIGINFVDFCALVNRFIRALGLTNIAIDAFFSYFQCHYNYPVKPFKYCATGAGTKLRTSPPKLTISRTN